MRIKISHGNVTGAITYP